MLHDESPCRRAQSPKHEPFIKGRCLSGKDNNLGSIPVCNIKLPCIQNKAEVIYTQSCGSHNTNSQADVIN